MRSHRFLPLILVTAAALTTTALTACTSEPAPRQTTAADTHGMPGYLDGLVEVRQFRGAVEVRRGDDVLFSGGFDRADVAGGVPNEPATRFRIGSLTKQFTAFAVLMLQEQGKLSVSDPVCTHLPSCPGAWRAITIDQLLTHTSGLFDYNELTEAEIAGYVAEIGTRPTPEQLIGTFVDRPLEFVPGSRWKYSNCGYDLLGSVVERLSGQTFGEFLDDRVLHPLGLSDTAYHPDQQPGEEDATGYQDWTTEADTLPDVVNFASGGMYSTVTDLSRWNRFLLTGRPALVTRDTLDQLVRPRVSVDARTRYGYGIETRGTEDSTTHSHDGAIAGFRSFSQFDSATGVSVVVLSNLDTADAGWIAENLTALARGQE